MQNRDIQRHVVMVHPEMPGNTGSAGRTCLGAGAVLHLIRPLGFSLEQKQVRRAGLDYWERVDLRVWDDLPAFFDALRPQPDELALLTRRAERPYWEIPAAGRVFLVFGGETQGLPEDLMADWPGNTFRIPVTDEIRSLNLATAIGIVLFDHLRAHGVPGGQDSR